MSTPLVIKRTSLEEDGTFYCEGLSVIGKSHTALDLPCQDYHYCEELDGGWKLFIVSDGAGSAVRSQEGARFMCEKAGVYVKQVIDNLGWENKSTAPSELDWYIECRAIFSQLKIDIRRQIGIQGEGNENDFSATIILVVYTPNFVLCGHIGDGRMGYRTKDGVWGSLMIPHKGDEPNQTIFVQSNWTYPQSPALRLHGVPVPETRVLSCPIDTIVMMSDGCESFAWDCDVFNESEQRIETINLPFPGFLDPLVRLLDGLKSSERNVALEKVITEGNELCIEETDDKTIILARFLTQSSISGQHEETESYIDEPVEEDSTITNDENIQREVTVLNGVLGDNQPE